MDDAFFEPDGDAFRATELTRGPWGDHLQHFGPLAALVSRAVEAIEADVPQRVARIAFEVLAPVPITTLRVSTQVVRPGRKVMLVESEVAGLDGDVYARARAWRLRTADLDLPAGLTGTSTPPMPAPEEGREVAFFLPSDRPAYHTATQWRFTTGAFLEPGPAAAWCRSLVALVAGEPLSPLQRVLVAADSGNGISAVADPRELVFVNTDLTVSLHREPEGEWIGMDATTVLQPNGSGLATTVLHDRAGPIGVGSQTLFVEGLRR